MSSSRRIKSNSSMFLVAWVLLFPVACANLENNNSELLNKDSGNNLFEKIIGGTLGFENEPTWPKPPRNADIFTTSKEVSHNFSASLTSDKIPGSEYIVSGGPRVEWNLTSKVIITTYVVASSNDDYKATSTPAQNPNKYNNDIFYEVRPKVIMVNSWGGTREVVYFCHYAVTRESASSGYGELKIAKAALSTTHGLTDLDKIEVNHMTKFSRVANNESLDSVKGYCEKKFADEKIEEELKRRLQTIYNDVYVFSPSTTCLIDEHCFRFQNSHFPGVPERTVSYCLPLENKAFQCQRFSKKNAPCPMFVDENHILTTKKTAKTQLATPGSFEFPCDKGLTCTMVKKPLYYGYVFSAGEAVCKDLN